MGRSIQLLVSCVIFILQQNVEGYSRIDPLVDTKLGLIRGLRATDGTYSMFLGIPFGKVDEANPFGIASPYPPFEHIFEAYDDSSMCPQKEEFNNTLAGTLDCLHLNIYVPNSATSKNRLPVLVWLYGGRFFKGFAGRTLYGPKYLVRHDVILVTVNYRLGPYGFMCLDIPEIPGNQGLKDQSLALRWIRNNIESFGGDANQITLMGRSAGSMSVGAHLISKQEKLFNKAILQSGSVLIPTFNKGAGAKTTLKLAQNLGFSTDNLSEALSFLAKADPLLVIAASLEEDIFLPCVEKEFKDVEAFLTEEPVNMNVPKVKGMPILLGFNADERVIYYVNQNPEEIEISDIFYEHLKSGFNFTKSDLEEMTKIVKHFYIGDEKISYDNIFKQVDFESDFMYIYPTERTIDSYLNSQSGKIFYYMFSYIGDRNFGRRKNNVTVGGAAHGDEIGYLFDLSFWSEKPSPEDQLIVDRMTMMWTNFVKYGDPTPETSELLPVKWKPITSDSSPRQYLNIDSELTMGRRPYHERTAFWDLFYIKNKIFQIGYDNSN